MTDENSPSLPERLREIQLMADIGLELAKEYMALVGEHTRLLNAWIASQQALSEANGAAFGKLIFLAEYRASSSSIVMSYVEFLELELLSLRARIENGGLAVTPGHSEPPV